MQKLTIASALAAGLLSAAAASAATVTLDFNAASGAYGTSVNELYNGGTDSAGSAGSNYGVSFSGSVLELNNNDGFGATYFSNSPTSTVIWAPTAGAGDVNAVMNVASGFAGGISLSYSSVAAPTTVSIWSGLNDTGTLLSILTLLPNSDGCTTGGACVWSLASGTFTGVAQSVDFTSNIGNALFTDISITPVPLPASGLLLSFGAAGLALFGARRRAV